MARVEIEETISFGPFRLLPGRRVLLRGDNMVRIGDRALDILIGLLARPGEVVGRVELAHLVWPNTFVEDGTLRVHVSHLRRILSDDKLGSGYVSNVPGKGYRFVGAATRTREIFGGSREASGQYRPLPVRPLIGREAELIAIRSLLAQRRFISVVGPAGVGKTSVALAVAEQFHLEYPHGVHFVDLASLADPALVPSAFASLLGVPIGASNPLSSLIAFLHDKHVLIVLDNCEHLIEATAALGETLFTSTTHVHILATSRETLRARGEFVRRLSPLELPPNCTMLTIADALASPAIRLFVERAIDVHDGFELTNDNTPTVVAICRRMDGIPLAIELVASRAEALSVAEIFSSIEDSFRPVIQDRRTAIPRHLTLSTALGWSYDLLSASERRVFRRLAIFSGGISLSAAECVADDGDDQTWNIASLLNGLVAKSLVNAEVDGGRVRYRLLETMRTYAGNWLRQLGERDRIAKRHAIYFRDLFECAATSGKSLDNSQWLHVYADELDNARAALDWAFSSSGDFSTGIALTIAVVPLWMRLSLMDECRSRAQRAIDHSRHDAEPDPRVTMLLYSALGAAQAYNRGPKPEHDAIWSYVLNMAIALGDVEHQLRALHGLWIGRIHNRRYSEALPIAGRFRDVAKQSTDPNDSLIGDRIFGLTLHSMGDQSAARRHTEHMLHYYVPPLDGAHVVRYQLDQIVAARTIYGRVLWLTGLFDQAMRNVNESVTEATAGGHVSSLCGLLAVTACPVSCELGNLSAANRYLTTLISYATEYGLTFWLGIGECLKGMLAVRRGDIRSGLAVLERVMDSEASTRFTGRYTPFLCELGGALLSIGEMARAMATIDRGFAISEDSAEAWYVPELLRTKGETYLTDRSPKALEQGEQCLIHSIDLARRQGALTFELRATMSLARLWRDQGQSNQARDDLSTVLGKFTEGFATADFCGARSLLTELLQP
jgi:predicted ATPase/DNA-binding winged helix-turn-helix (wHTH) protein